MYFYRSAVAVVFSVTALLKFVAIARHERLLQTLDPLLGVNLGSVAIVAALAELLLAIYVLYGSNLRSVLIAIHLFSVVLLLYRFGVGLSGRAPCPCLGGGVSWWPWLDKHQSNVTLGLALWFWLTSLICLARNTVKEKTDEHPLQIASDYESGKPSS